MKSFLKTICQWFYLTEAEKYANGQKWARKILLEITNEDEFMYHWDYVAMSDNQFDIGARLILRTSEFYRGF